MLLLQLHDVESRIFSGGEVHVRLENEYLSAKEVTIGALLDSSDSIMKLLMVTDALKRANATKIIVILSYLPYARQDRVCNIGEALSIKVLANIINSQNYYEVYVLDPHSDVGPALLNNCTIIPNHKFIKNVIDDVKERDGLDDSNIVIVSPDAGSNKKVKDLMKYLNSPELSMVKCDKTRDTLTGDLTGFEVYADSLANKICIIVDDICDGGGTFNGLAEVLLKKGATNIYLAVTHGIFSKGFEELSKNFDHIYTTQSFPGQRNEELVTVLNP